MTQRVAYSSGMTEQPGPDRPLTDRQCAVLADLAAHNAGRWWYGCGWMSETRSSTTRTLDTLVRRGLVAITVNTTVRTADEPRGRKEYTITEQGRTVNRSGQNPTIETTGTENPDDGQDEDNDAPAADLGPDAVELFQLAATGCVEVRRVITEAAIVTSFNLLAELAADPVRSPRPIAPLHAYLADPHVLTAMVVSAARNGYLELVWDNPGAPWWTPMATGTLNATDKAHQALAAHWPTFTPQGALGEQGWTQNPTVAVPRAALVAGNIVHSSKGIRFQIARVHHHRSGQMTQIWSAQSEHTERYDSAHTIAVEVASLLPGQRIR